MNPIIEAMAKAVSNAMAKSWCHCGEPDVPDDESCAFCNRAALASWTAGVAALTDDNCDDVWTVLNPGDSVEVAAARFKAALLAVAKGGEDG